MSDTRTHTSTAERVMAATFDLLKVAGVRPRFLQKVDADLFDCESVPVECANVEGVKVSVHEAGEDAVLVFVTVPVIGMRAGVPRSAIVEDYFVWL